MDAKGQAVRAPLTSLMLLRAGASTDHSMAAARSGAVPSVRFGSPQGAAATFRRVLAVPGSQAPVVASSQCRHGDWRTSFDSRGWSTCPPSALFINGLYRSQWGQGPVSEAIAMLDRVQCCEAPLSYKDMPTAFQSVDWSETFKRCAAAAPLTPYHPTGLAGRRLRAIETAVASEVMFVIRGAFWYIL